MRLALRDRVVELHPGRPLVMGIVNANPDSFSDPGARTADDLMRAAMVQVNAGADLIDVGGESGVTNAAPVAPEVEIERVLPLVERLVAKGITVSVDTWKAPVAEAVLAAGASMINDVSGLRDPAIADACAEYRASLVIMHTRAEPKVKAFPGYDDVVADVEDFLSERMAIALERGVGEEAIVLDPGPDFAKTPMETIQILQALPRLAELGKPLLLAVSRKDFVGALTGQSPRARLAGTLAAVGHGAGAGAAIVRVHDVAEVVDFLHVHAALAGVPVDRIELPDELRREEHTA